MRLAGLAVIASSLVGLSHSLIQGFDINGAEPFPDWEGAYKGGARFVVTRATAGIVDIDQRFQDHWADAKKEGFYRGALHLGRPSESTGKEQAEFFLSQGGRWIKDNSTLPGFLRMNGPDAGHRCWGLNATQIREWITEWTTTYFKATGRQAIIHTSMGWFDECTNNWSSFPAHAQWAVLSDSNIPPNDRDMEIIYGVGWIAWYNTKPYGPGGQEVLWNGNMDMLRDAVTGVWP